MSEEHSDPRAQEDAGAAQPEPGPSAAPDPPRQRSASRLVIAWLGPFAMLTVAAVALSPFWAPVLAPLLPWGASPAAADYEALAARVAAIENRPPPSPGAVEQVNSALAALGRRVAQLEGAPGAPAGSPSGVLDAIKSAQNEQARRLDALEAGRRESSQTESTAGARQADLQLLEQRLTALEAQSSARTAGDATDLQNIKQQLSRVDSTSADITKRISALEQQVRSESAGQTEAALAIVLLQIRQAVERGRPFPAEYGALKMLAADAHLTADAAPLAEASQSGVASRIVLSKRLAELAGRVGGAEEPTAETGWGAWTLARLRGLVTIRRIDGLSQSGPEAAVSSAQARLSRGDLADAVAALDALTGPDAEAAKPWLRMAQQRVAVEAALDHLQQSLEATLGRTRATPDAPPAGPSTKTRTPS